MRRKKFPSLQFMNRDRMRLLLTPLRNGRSMPLRKRQYLFIFTTIFVICVYFRKQFFAKTIFAKKRKFSFSTLAGVYKYSAGGGLGVKETPRKTVIGCILLVRNIFSFTAWLPPLAGRMYGGPGEKGR